MLLWCYLQITLCFLTCKEEYKWRHLVKCFAEIQIQHSGLRSLPIIRWNHWAWLILVLNNAGSQWSQLPFLSIHNASASSIPCSFARIHAWPRSSCYWGSTVFLFMKSKTCPIHSSVIPSNSNSSKPAAKVLQLQLQYFLVT